MAKIKYPNYIINNKINTHDNKNSKWIDFLYEDYCRWHPEFKIEQFININECFINIYDIQTILNPFLSILDETYEKEYEEHEILCHYLKEFDDYYNSNPFVEIMLNGDELDDCYVKINSKNIKIAKLTDGTYFTLEKILPNEIISIEQNMKTLNRFINDEIFEGIQSTWSKSTVVDKLISFVGIHKDSIHFEHPDREKSKIYIDINQDWTESEYNEIKKWLLIFANVAGYKFTEELNKSFKLSPYKPESCDNIIYNKNDGIIYHLTSKYFYNKLKNETYLTSRSNFGWENKSRVYVFSGNLDKLKHSICILRNFSKRIFNKKQDYKYYEKNILLKFDLNECKEKPKFYYDPDYKTSGGIAAFTRDNIPIECLVDTFEVTPTKIIM